jgi:hypothetical protein
LKNRRLGRNVRRSKSGICPHRSAGVKMGWSRPPWMGSARGEVPFLTTRTCARRERIVGMEAEGSALRTGHRGRDRFHYLTNGISRESGMPSGSPALSRYRRLARARLRAHRNGRRRAEHRRSKSSIKLPISTVCQLQPVAFRCQRSGQGLRRHAHIGNSSCVETCEEITGTAFD